LTKSKENRLFGKKKYANPCIFQKKAVPLHPLSEIEISRAPENF
jgi:hypothetical protein